MTARPLLLAAGASLLLGHTAIAEPAFPAPHPELEAEIRAECENVEERIRQLELAGRHLEAAGLPDEADRVRQKASRLRKALEQRRVERERLARQQAEDQRRRELEDLIRDAMAQVTKDLRRELGAELEAEPAPPHPPAVDPDRALIEENNRQALRTWERIRGAARGKRPAAPMTDPAPPEQRPPLPPASLKADLNPAPGQQEILEQILRTLQRIERRMEQQEERSSTPRPRT